MFLRDKKISVKILYFTLVTDKKLNTNKYVFEIWSNGTLNITHLAYEDKFKIFKKNHNLILAHTFDVYLAYLIQLFHLCLCFAFHECQTS